jgi:hypothetical protein
MKRSGNTIRKKKERIKGNKRFGHDIETMLLAESRVKGRRRMRGRGSYKKTQQVRLLLPHLLGPITNADYVTELTSTLLITRLVQKLKSNEDGVNSP